MENGAFVPKIGTKDPPSIRRCGPRCSPHVAPASYLTGASACRTGAFYVFAEAIPRRGSYHAAHGPCGLAAVLSRPASLRTFGRWVCQQYQPANDGCDRGTLERWKPGPKCCSPWPECGDRRTCSRLRCAPAVRQPAASTVSRGGNLTEQYPREIGRHWASRFSLPDHGGMRSCDVGLACPELLSYSPAWLTTPSLEVANFPELSAALSCHHYAGLVHR